MSDISSKTESALANLNICCTDFLTLECYRPDFTKPVNAVPIPSPLLALRITQNPSKLRDHSRRNAAWLVGHSARSDKDVRLLRVARDFWDGNFRNLSEEKTGGEVSREYLSIDSGAAFCVI